MDYAVSIQDLHKTYDNGLSALKGIDLNVAKGDFFALLGPNGAGKSTIIGILCSLVRKTSGKVRWVLRLAIRSRKIARRVLHEETRLVG